MVNDEKYINEVLDKLKKVSDEEIMEAIKKVDLEDDIKILEERVTTLKRHIKNYEESDCKTNVYQQLVKECNAIENLLKRYKELKEENEQLKVNEEILMKTKGCLNEDNSTNCRVLESLNYGIRAYEKTLKNSIPISVIQNKIDFYKKNFNMVGATSKINVLQELLEERNK